jgi:hypothetical protein
MKRVTFAALLLALAVSASVVRTSARTATQAGSDLLQLLPDGGAVVLIDMHRVTTSNLWATLGSQEKIRTALEKMQSEAAGLGIRLPEIQSVALAFPSSSMSNPVVAVSGGFDQSDLLSRLRADSKVKITSEKYKNFEIFKAESVAPPASDKPAEPGKDAKPVHKDDTSFVFYDSRTAVIGPASVVRASVDTKLGGKSIAQNAKLSEALAQNSTAAIRFAVEVTPAMTSGIQSSGMPLPDFSSVKLIFGSIDLNTGVDLVATLRNDSAEHAKVVAERLNGLLEMVRGFLTASNDPKTAPIVSALKTASVTGSDVDVKVIVSVPLEVIMQLIK